jgi:hypothetical protein
MFFEYVLRLSTNSPILCLRLVPCMNIYFSGHRDDGETLFTDIHRHHARMQDRQRAEEAMMGFQGGCCPSRNTMIMSALVVLHVCTFSGCCPQFWEYSAIRKGSADAYMGIVKSCRGSCSEGAHERHVPSRNHYKQALRQGLNQVHTVQEYRMRRETSRFIMSIIKDWMRTGRTGV